MNVLELQKSGWLIYESVAGSHLYGTNTNKSDIDIRGIYILPKEKRDSLYISMDEIGDERSDIKYYSLKKFMLLASECNPNILELLYKIDGCVRYSSKQHDLLYSKRDLFFSKKAKYSYSGYAYSQIKRAKGQNKKINEYEKYVDNDGIEKLKELLRSGKINDIWLRHRFCGDLIKYMKKDGFSYDRICDNDFVMMDSYLEDLKGLRRPIKEDYVYIMDSKGSDYPFRPRKSNIGELDNYDCSGVEHTPYLNRLYRNGGGIFSSDDQIMYTSISCEREWEDFVGVMYYNEVEFNKNVTEYLNFWEWMANRNEVRYTGMDKKEIDYDCKNIMHTMRLLLEAENISKYGELLIRFSGDDLKLLMDIRNGLFSYDSVMGIVEEKMLRLDDLFKESYLPERVNRMVIDELYFELLEIDK